MYFVRVVLFFDTKLLPVICVYSGDFNMLDKRMFIT